MNTVSIHPSRMLGSLVLLSAALAPGLAFADTTDCTTITSLPKAITAPGRYCLAASLASDSTAPAKIDIRSSNVLLDCNDHQISYTGAPGSNGFGVRIPTRNDVTVRNCRFVNFGTAIEVANSRRVLIDSNHADGSLTAGIRVNGYELDVRENTVTNTLGANGLVVQALADGSAQVRHNVVSRVLPASGPATGIRVGGGGRVLLRDNIVREVGGPTNTQSAAIVVASSASLVPSPAVVMNGGLFKGAGATNYAVQSTTGKVVCEGTSYFFYTPPYIPGCL